jgi:hypothetical protein
MIADKLDISRDTVRKIVEDLTKRKVCMHFIQHAWTSEQEEDQVAAYQDLIQMADSDPDFLKKKKVIHGDKSWCFAYSSVMT